MLLSFHETKRVLLSACHVPAEMFRLARYRPILPALLFSILIICSVSHAEEPKQAKGKGDSNLSTDQIFSDIMQTLPKDLKLKVEDANDIMNDRKKSEAAAEEQKESAEQVEEQKQKALQELPEEVRVKVEKVIKEMDGRIKERQGQLKELDK
jgi:hypothetical protein